MMGIIRPWHWFKAGKKEVRAYRETILDNDKRFEKIKVVRK